MQGIKRDNKWYKQAIEALKTSATAQEAARKLGISYRTLCLAFADRGEKASDFIAARPALTDIAAARAHADRHATAKDVRALQQRLIEAERAADFYTSIREIPAIAVSASRPKSGKRVATPVTVASDWHVGEVVTAEETLGRNVYDLATARKRAGEFWDNVLWLRKDGARHQTFDDHVLVLGGDIISGSIHPELVETNAIPLNDQVSEAIAMLRPGIVELAKVSRKLVIICVAGNHGRITDKSRIKTGWANSLEVALYRWLRDSLQGYGNIEWHIPRAEGFAIDVHGLRMQVQHGTQIKSQGGIGGILVPLTRWAVRAASADLYVFGHFHTACAFESVIVNGSLIGDSAYSKWHGMTFRPPEQVNFAIDARRGVRHFERVSVT